jgi:hypothetical protein
VGTVEHDLRVYEQEQYDRDRCFDPADLSEVDLFEFTDFLGDLTDKDRVKLVQAVRAEDWDQFAIEVRAMLIASRTDM